MFSGMEIILKSKDALDCCTPVEDQKLEVDQEWVKTGCARLLISHKTKILNAEELNDVIIYFAQKLLKKQFPAISGLQNTVLQAKMQNDVGGQQCSWQCLQVIHSCGNQWIVASNVHLEGSDKVMVYDSIDDRTQVIIHELFGVSKHDVAKVHKQQGVRDYGLIAIAFATAICFGQDFHEPFHQEAMHLHLV